MGFQYRTFKTCAFGRWPPRTTSPVALAGARAHMRSEKHCEKVRRGLYSPEASVESNSTSPKEFNPSSHCAMVACRARLAKGAYLFKKAGPRPRLCGRGATRRGPGFGGIGLGARHCCEQPLGAALAHFFT